MESWVMLEDDVLPVFVPDFVINLFCTATRPIKEEEDDSRCACPCEEGEDERTTVGDENAKANLDDILSSKSTAHKSATTKTTDRIDTVLAILKILTDIREREREREREVDAVESIKFCINYCWTTVYNRSN